MYQQIVVPVDESCRSWMLAGAAAEVAARCGCPLVVMSVAASEAGQRKARMELEGRIAGHSWYDRAIPRVVVSHGRTFAECLARVADKSPGGLLVMDSAGSGLGGSVIGKSAESLLRDLTTPVLLYGPRTSSRAPYGGSVVVAIDHADPSEKLVALAEMWGASFHADPWLVTVSPANPGRSVALVESDDRCRQPCKADDRATRSVRRLTLRGNRPATMLARFAASVEAAVIIEVFDSLGGLDRLHSRSVAMATVRRAEAPVLVMHGVDSPAALPGEVVAV